MNLVSSSLLGEKTPGSVFPSASRLDILFVQRGFSAFFYCRINELLFELL